MEFEWDPDKNGRNIARRGIDFAWAIETFKGLSTQQIGFVTAIPYVVAASGMYLFGRHSDARGERRLHLAFAVAGVALIAIPYIGPHIGPPVVTLLVL